MFLKEVKAILTQGMRNTFVSSYPVSDFADLYIDIEYPMLKQNYPGMWVGFEPMGTIDRAGINNSFGYAQYGADGLPSVNSLWRATGFGTFTLAALTSLQRDRLFDEVIRVFAFNRESPVAPFRNMIEANPLIGMNMNFDNIAIRGVSENPGTPWGTTEIIYEATLAVEAQIEFASDQAATLTPLAAVDVVATSPENTQWQATVPQPWMGQ